MVGTDFDSMEISELKDHIAKAEAALAKKVEDKKKDFIADVKRQAEELGLDPSELFGSAASGKKRKPAKPKYRNPDDPSITWTGQGRTPKWAEGRLEEVRIKD